MIVYYLVGAVIGGLVGYLVLYRLIGCSTGACTITADPYISTLYGIILGVLLVSGIASPKNPAALNDATLSSATEYKKITAEDAKARIDSENEVVILDVRTEEEYKAAHVPNAILLPNETITDTMPDLLPDPDAEILIYCRSGNRSAQAAKKLIAIGYTNVYDFGGINDWPYDTITEP